MITRLYDEYPQKQEITLLPSELVAPLSLKEIRLMLKDTENKELEEKVEHAFAIHYFLGSWFDQLKR